MHWIRPDLKLEPGNVYHCTMRIRYRQPVEKAEIYLRKDGAWVLFDDEQRGITQGQFAAWYSGDELIGSGVIS